MKLCDFCIKRPVFATVLSLILIFCGWIGFENLEIVYMPNVQQKNLTVSASLPGGSPEYIYNNITMPIEGAIKSVDGIEEFSSSARNGSSSTTITLSPATNVVQAISDINSNIANIQDLPDSLTKTPTASYSTHGQRVMNIGFQAKGLNPSQLRNYLQKEIVPQFQRIQGIGPISYWGGNTYALKIWLDPIKMAAYKVTATDVLSKIQNSNIDVSIGSIDAQGRNYAFQANTKLNNPNEFKNIAIKTSSDGSSVLRLKDIATIDFEPDTLQARSTTFNGIDTIALDMYADAKANPVLLAQRILKKYAEIKKKLPKSINSFVARNNANFIKEAIDESIKTLFEAIVLVIIIIYLFLGSIRATIIPIVTIPICCIASLGLIKLFGFKINSLTLLAIILAIGLVVDDAIVMLENIYRHIEEGMQPKSAAFLGSKEIGFSIIAMTITLAAVYAPTGFVSGMTAELFREFAFTLAGAVIISGFVALTLSPMMCAYMLKPKQKEAYLSKKLNIVFAKFTNFYQKTLIILLKNFWITIILLLVVGVIGFFTYRSTPQKLIPEEDQGFITLTMTFPNGANSAFQEKYAKLLAKKLQKVPGVKYSIITGNASFLFLKNWKERPSAFEINNYITKNINDFAAISVSTTLPPTLPSGTSDISAGLEVFISTTEQDTKKLYKTMQSIAASMQNNPIFTNISNKLQFNTIAWDISFKLKQIQAYGANPSEIRDTLQTLFTGSSNKLGNLTIGTTTYPVKARMQKKDLSRFSVLDDIYVSGKNNAMIPVKNLINIKTSIAQGSIASLNGMLGNSITSSTPPQMGENDIIKQADKIIESKINQNQSFQYKGNIKQFLESSGTMTSLFVLSIVFIYLILAAQFESFVDPLIILFTVPLCIVSAIVTLKVTGGSINIITQIGLITLVGLITKHGILITQFANDNLKAGQTLFNSVLNSGLTRLRPIIMTTLAMVLGSIPLALATGPGSNSHSQIGWVIVGGMFFGTIFSLLVVPVAYMILARLDYNKRILIRKNEN
jgi:multidrug efflux pump